MVDFFSSSEDEHNTKRDSDGFFEDVNWTEQNSEMRTPSMDHVNVNEWMAVATWPIKVQSVIFVIGFVVVERFSVCSHLLQRGTASSLQYYVVAITRLLNVCPIFSKITY